MVWRVGQRRPSWEDCGHVMLQRMHRSWLGNERWKDLTSWRKQHIQMPWKSLETRGWHRPGSFNKFTKMHLKKLSVGFKKVFCIKIDYSLIFLWTLGSWHRSPMHKQTLPMSTAAGIGPSWSLELGTWAASPTYLGDKDPSMGARATLTGNQNQK